MSFVKRRLQFDFRLGTGSFGATGANTATASGLRATATITKSGAIGMNSLEATIYGLDKSIANSISTLGKPLTDGRNNVVKVSAGDESGVSVVFIGTIYTAWSDYNGAPDVNVTISAKAGFLDALRPLPPTSFKGQADVATIISGLAAQMGYAFENGGVSVQLPNPYYSGTGRDQAYRAAKDANINIIIDDAPGGAMTVAIWPKTGQRGGEVPLISAETGMVGYPIWIENGLVVKTLYNPSIIVGGTVNVKSSIPNATKDGWPVFALEHNLQSETVDGEWFSTASCSLARAG